MLCGPEARYVTGASWAVDGGLLLMSAVAAHHLDDDAWRKPALTELPPEGTRRDDDRPSGMNARH